MCQCYLKGISPCKRLGICSSDVEKHAKDAAYECPDYAAAATC